MRLTYASALIGAAALGLAAFGPAALAKDPPTHEMTIQLPGGGTEIIRYVGNVAPKVSFAEAPFGMEWLAPVTFGFDPSIAALDRIAADMNRRMDAFWRQAQAMANGSAKGDLSQAALQDLGPGGSAYSVVSQSFGNNICTRMTEITASTDGGKPRVVSRTSGNCDAGPGRATAGSIATHGAAPATGVQRTAL